MKRWASVIALAILGTFLASAPADAKMPYFDVTVTPPSPIAGEPTLIVLRMWQDATHRIPAQFEPVTLDRLLVLRPEEAGWSDISVSLRYQPDRGDYRATVVIPSVGEWKLVAFPDRSGWSSPQVPAGYPDAITLNVRSGSDAPRTLADPELSGSRPDPTQPVDYRVALLVGALFAFMLLIQRHTRARVR
jgi:hypothetical protein